MTDQSARDSLVREAVRAADHDRYLSTLYAPAEKRTALLALYAFDIEIAGVRDRVSEALPGEIRLQWWRDVIAAGDRAAGAGNPLAEAVLEAIATHDLPLQAFDNLIDARIFDLYNDPMPSRTDLEGYCGETSGAILQLAAMILDRKAAARVAGQAGHAGCAQGIVSMLRSLPCHRARGQCYVPRDLLAVAGTTADDFLRSDDDAARATAVMAALAGEHVSAFEAAAPDIPASLRAAFLPLALARPYLSKIDGQELAALRHSANLSPLRRHWLLLRRAGRGWR